MHHAESCKVRRLRKAIILIATLAFLVACSKPLPEDKKDFVGEWQNDVVWMMFHADGSFNYLRKEGSTSVEINAPVLEITDDRFRVGVWVWDTEFVINESPHQREGVWYMVVDGRVLTKLTN